MKIFIAGNSHLTHYTKIGAAFRGLNVCNSDEEADLILIAQDAFTDNHGHRTLIDIVDMVDKYCPSGKPVILMSQVQPGFCRAMSFTNLYHYPETLRIKDSYERATRPEYIVLGKYDMFQVPNEFVYQYCKSFSCPFFELDYETAEMCKIAVNTMLAAQVDATNKLAAACDSVGAQWWQVARVIGHDKRIGHEAYLVPGRWQDSLHLLRDSVTLKEIECTQKPT